MTQRLLRAFFFILVFPVSVAADPLPVIEWRDQRLSIAAKNSPLADLLRTVAQQTGVEVQGLEGVQEVVSIQLFRVPLQTGLQHLLSSFNHLMLTRTTPNGEACPTLILVLGRKRPTESHPRDDLDETPLLAAPRVQWLQKQNPNQRLAALQQLDPLPATQRSALLKAALQDTDPSVRQVAYRLLYEQGEKETLAAALKQEARSSDSERRQTALEAFGEFFPTEATELLLQATTDEHPDVRSTAFAQLSHLDLPEAEQALRTQLAHPDREVRLLAVEALAARGAQVAREAALTALADSDELVRGKGANLLQELQISVGGVQ
ncbi:MAG TPA: HEAT repeat domain-containing protein [Methylomirabilota bacterium]|jgi:hypothetical protein|nr:HEAT repeat domain-containing protein [Methylomirabilota bacterium]